MSVTVLCALGTRPEAIKLAPIIRAVRADPGLRARVLLTAQHRELLDQTLASFGLAADVDLDLMRPDQSLAQFTSRALEAVDQVLALERPDIVLVQGDTTTVLAVALAAFYRGIAVGHVEAGLRSFDLANPFPEEANRRLTGQLASLHFAPTRRAEGNLMREGIPPERIHLTGNTVVDALHWMLERPDLPGTPAAWRQLSSQGTCRVLVTLHRRESWGAALAAICRALRRAVDSCEQLHLLYPVHPQPRVRETVASLLAGHARIALVEPLDYAENVVAMRDATFVVTDSGGIQEEAPVLGKPVLVVREVTERPEAVEAGVAWLVGTGEDTVYAAVTALARDEDRRRSMARAISPFGDGRASERVVATIRRFAGLAPSADEPNSLWT